jgi:hypothetical protein
MADSIAPGVGLRVLQKQHRRQQRFDPCITCEVAKQRFLQGLGKDHNLLKSRKY